jgi:hypothetical protein
MCDWDRGLSCECVCACFQESECVVYYRENVHHLAQAANWCSLVKTSLDLQSCPLFQIYRRPKYPRSVYFWSSLLIWKRGHDCSSNNVFIRLCQFATCAKLCTFTLHVVAFADILLRKKLVGSLFYGYWFREADQLFFFPPSNFLIFSIA